MKIIQLTAENIKKLRVVSLKPDGKTVIIGGQNEQGKSSVLDSILMALGGGSALPDQPIRHGQKKAEITLDLGELKVTRRFTEGGGTSLVVTNKEGDKKSSPQQVLDKLVGKLTFDPLGFARLEPKQQRETLAKLANLDFEPINAEYAKLYEQRRDQNREVDRLKASLAGQIIVPDLPEEEISGEEILAKLSDAQAHNRHVQEKHQYLRDVQARVTLASRDATSAQATVDALREQLAEAEAILDKRKKTLAGAERDAKNITEANQAISFIDEAPIKAELLAAQSKNDAIRRNKAIRDLQDQLESATIVAAEITKLLTAQLDKKAELLQKAKFPLPGLSITDDAVFFEGIPFKQASSARQIQVSTAIGIALNPALRVMLIRDGSLLDSNSLAALHELAAQHDVQLWIERVGAGEEVSVVISDGAVAEDRLQPSPK